MFIHIENKISKVIHDGSSIMKETFCTAPVHFNARDPTNCSVSISCTVRHRTLIYVDVRPVQHFIKFSSNKYVKASETLRRLRQQFGNETLERAKVFKWHKLFCRGSNDKHGLLSAHS